MHVIRKSGPYYESFFKSIDIQFLYDVLILFIVYHLLIFFFSLLILFFNFHHILFIFSKHPNYLKDYVTNTKIRQIKQINAINLRMGLTTFPSLFLGFDKVFYYF